MKILVAEDDPMTLKPYEVALNAGGHQVMVTDNGEDCLRIYQDELDKFTPSENASSPFDAVLLDYRMPKKMEWKLPKRSLS